MSSSFSLLLGYNATIKRVRIKVKKLAKKTYQKILPKNIDVRIIYYIVGRYARKSSMTPTKFIDKLKHLPQRAKYIGISSLCLLAIMVAIFIPQSRNDNYQASDISLVASDDDLTNMLIVGFETINNDYRACIAQHDASNVAADMACMAIRDEKAEAMKGLLREINGTSWAGEYHYEYRDEHGGEYQYQHEYRDEHKSEYRLYQ